MNRFSVQIQLTTEYGLECSVCFDEKKHFFYDINNLFQKGTTTSKRTR